MTEVDAGFAQATRRACSRCSALPVLVASVKAPTTILVGKVDEPILGLEALEALGLMVDPRRKRLSSTRPYAVRLGG